jgi:uncharacterized membrane protein YcfT
VLALAGLLQILPVHTGSGILDQFAEYFVYFYGGYALAPAIFRIVAWAQRNADVAVGLLVGYGLINAALVFGGPFRMLPAHAEMGLAALPGLHLVLAFAGSVALCVVSALLMRLKWMDWLRWLGARSIVVYLSFSIPMAATRVLLVKLDVIEDTGMLSTIVMLVALVSPLVLYRLIQLTGWGRFLFERPAWAHFPGTPGSRPLAARASAAPAE